MVIQTQVRKGKRVDQVSLSEVEKHQSHLIIKYSHVGRIIWWLILEYAKLVSINEIMDELIRRGGKKKEQSSGK